MAKILVLEDETLLARSMARSLTRVGHECVTAATAVAGLQVARATRLDVVLLDIRLPDMHGLEALQQLKEIEPELIVIVITAYGSIQNAVEAMKLGATDYMAKPLDLDELKLVVTRALEDLQRQLTYYQQKDARQAAMLQILGASRAMQAVLTLVQRLARMDPQVVGELPTVLILGETGTGKDLIARALHVWSPLAAQPFVDVNCTTLPKELFEAELFGYDKGAFTDAKTAKPGLIEAAAGGTLFLDEIGDLPLEAQAKLLKVIEQKIVRRVGSLQERHLQVRIVAATNRDLEASVQAGTFRQDLFYRLQVLTVQLPPLRARDQDAVLLAEHFLQTFTQKYATGPRSLTAAAMTCLQTYPWPGNVRELAHVIERAVLLSDHQDIGPELLALSPRSEATPQPDAPRSLPPPGVGWAQMERQLLTQALLHTQGNVSEAARQLGISREAMRYRLRKYAIAIPSPSG